MTTTQKLTVLILVVSFILRLPHLGGSFWLDEAAQALESSRPLNQQLDIAYDFQPPLLHVILHFVMLVSYKEAWMRLCLALVPALATIFFTISIGKQLLGNKQGLLAGFLLGISSFHIYYSQELRPYSLPALFPVLSWYLLITNAKKVQSNRRNWGILFASAAGLYSSYLYPFILLGQLGYTFFISPSVSKKRNLTALFLSIVLFLPWLPKFFEQLHVGGTLRNNLPGWEEVVSIPQLKAIPLTAAKFVYGVLDIAPTIFFISSAVILLTLIGCGVFSYLQKLTTQKKQFLWVVVFWGILPLILAWIISFVVPVIQPKRMLLIQPAFALTVATLITTLLEDKNKTVSFAGKALFTLFIGISLFSTSSYYTNKKLQRENWRELHATIVREYPKKSVAVFSFPEPFAPWSWYDTTNYPTISTGVIHISKLENVPNTLKRVTSYDTILVFDYLRDLTDPNDLILATIQGFGYTEVGTITYPGIGFVRIYSTKATRLSNVL